MSRKNLARAAGAACVIGMLCYLGRDRFTPPNPDYQYCRHIRLFSLDLLAFMVVTSLGCLLMTHGVRRAFAAALHVAGRGGNVGAKVIAEDLEILSYLSRTVMGVGRLGLLLGVVMVLRNLQSAWYYIPHITFAMALLPILYASGFTTLVIGPARETLRARLEEARDAG